MQPTVIILAAGRAERMGRVKALLPLPLPGGGAACSALAAVARLYRACGLEDILVVSGFYAAAVEAEAGVLGLAAARNPAPEEGMFSSVRTGLAALARRHPGRPVFVHPVDVPLVRPLTVQALLAAAREAAATDAATSPPVFVPVFAGREGHPPLIPAAAAPRILAYGGRGGLQGALADLPRRLVPTPDALMLQDMDTPEDYTRLSALAAAREALSPAEAEVLLALRAVPEKGLRHARAVGTVAARFAAELARCRTAAGMAAQLDSELARAGGLLHDVCKGQPCHERAGGELLDSLALPRMAALVRGHRDLRLPDAQPVTERELVCLADKYCRGGEFVPLARRFALKMAQYAGDAAACAAIAGRLHRARLLEARLAAETGRAPADMAQEALAAAAAMPSGGGGA